jgi:hypothetical protein
MPFDLFGYRGLVLADSGGDGFECHAAVESVLNFKPLILRQMLVLGRIYVFHNFHSFKEISQT